MTTVAIIGDGPGGLSAALLLAKNGIDTTVYAQDETPMHYALLRNYLGIERMTGSDFQALARRQVTDHGATLLETEVTAVRRGEDGRFTVETEEASTDVDAVVLAGGKQAQALAAALGATAAEGQVEVDADQRTGVPGLYAVGRVVRPTRSQAIISAGAGAVAALDLLSRAAGKDVQDWDSPPAE